MEKVRTLPLLTFILIPFQVVPEDIDGILSEDGAAPDPPPSPNVSMFSRFLSQIFDQSTWTSDPLEKSHSAIDGDMGMAVASAMSSATSGVASSTSPRPGQGQFSGQMFSPQRECAQAAASHPSRQLLVTGCPASGRVHLWQFGGPRALAAYTPVPPSDLSAAQADTGLLSFSARFSRSTSLTARLGNWGGAKGLAFADSGERFAAVGEGGVVATWRLGGGAGRPADVDGALCAEWWHHVSVEPFLHIFNDNWIVLRCFNVD